MRIDRCVCHDVTFEAMHHWCTARGGATLLELQSKFKCGTSCGLCRPYVLRMVRTGQTVFFEVLTEGEESP